MLRGRETGECRRGRVVLEPALFRTTPPRAITPVRARSPVGVRTSSAFPPRRASVFLSAVAPPGSRHLCPPSPPGRPVGGCCRGDDHPPPYRQGQSADRRLPYVLLAARRPRTGDRPPRRQAGGGALIYSWAMPAVLRGRGDTLCRPTLGVERKIRRVGSWTSAMTSAISPLAEDLTNEPRSPRSQQSGSWPAGQLLGGLRPCEPPRPVGPDHGDHQGGRQSAQGHHGGG